MAVYAHEKNYIKIVTASADVPSSALPISLKF